MQSLCRAALLNTNVPALMVAFQPRQLIPRARKLTAPLCSLLTAHFLPKLRPCTANEVQNAKVSFHWNDTHDRGGFFVQLCRITSWSRLVEHVTVPQCVFYAPTRIWRGGNSSWSLSSYSFKNLSIKCNGLRLFAICQPSRKIKTTEGTCKKCSLRHLPEAASKRFL